MASNEGEERILYRGEFVAQVLAGADKKLERTVERIYESLLYSFMGRRPLTFPTKRIAGFVHGSPLLIVAASLNAVVLSSANPLFFIWLCVVDA